MNAIKNSFLDRTDTQIMDTQPIVQLPNNLDDDYEDIAVRPGHSKPTSKPTTRPTPRPTTRPTRPTTTLRPTTTTESPVLADPIEEERFKVVCYYTNWAWYRYAII